MTKICGRCRTRKPHAEFSRDRSKWDEKKWCCKACEKEYRELIPPDVSDRFEAGVLEYPCARCDNDVIGLRALHGRRYCSARCAHAH